MAKDPAFLFYSNDFISGTQFFSDSQVGIYIRLLCAQHQHGRLNEKDMMFICKTYDKDVFSKFIKDSDGKWYNQRFEDEMFKRKKYSESRSKNRSSIKKICSTYDNHMENENENENIIDIKKENEIQKPDEKNYNLELPEITLGAAVQYFNDLKYQKITDGKQATNNHDRQAAIRKRLREKAEALYFAGDQPKDD